MNLTRRRNKEMRFAFDARHGDYRTLTGLTSYLRRPIMSATSIRVHRLCKKA
jgi:hypothetical protein